MHHRSFVFKVNQEVSTREDEELYTRERAALGFLREAAMLMNVFASWIVSIAELNEQGFPAGAKGSRGAER
jgi:hypothetical protein